MSSFWKENANWPLAALLRSENIATSYRRKQNPCSTVARVVQCTCVRSFSGIRPVLAHSPKWSWYNSSSSMLCSSQELSLSAIIFIVRKQQLQTARASNLHEYTYCTHVPFQRFDVTEFAIHEMLMSRDVTVVFVNKDQLSLIKGPQNAFFLHNKCRQKGGFDFSWFVRHSSSI